MSAAACAWLVDAITSPQAPAAGRRLAATSIAARAGLDIYRHAYRARLRECLSDDFPALAALMGPEGFTALADRVIAAHPPREATLNRYGRRLVQHLRRTSGQATAHLDLARLEWALVEALHAPLAPCLSSDDIASAAAHLETMRLLPAPSLRIVLSAWSIDLCYRHHLRGEAVLPPQRDGEGVLIVRQPDGLRRLALPPQAARLVARLARGRPLGAALAACRLTAGTVRTTLADAVAIGAFTAISRPEPA